MRQGRGTRRSGWDPKEVYLGGRRAALAGVSRGTGGRFGQELTGSIQVKPSSKFCHGRVVAIGRRQPTKLMSQANSD